MLQRLASSNALELVEQIELKTGDLFVGLYEVTVYIDSNVDEDGRYFFFDDNMWVRASEHTGEATRLPCLAHTGRRVRNEGLRGEIINAISDALERGWKTTEAWAIEQMGADQ